eukprot:366444-Chlamydomonas_euryale.AAC.5
MIKVYAANSAIFFRYLLGSLMGGFFRIVIKSSDRRSHGIVELQLILCCSSISRVSLSADKHQHLAYQGLRLAGRSMGHRAGQRIVRGIFREDMSYAGCPAMTGSLWDMPCTA